MPKKTASKLAPHTPFPFRLGADPELSLRQGDPGIACDQRAKEDSAQSVFSKEKLSVPQRSKKKTAEVGIDGSGGPGELRVAPANTPQGLIENLYECFRIFSERFENHWPTTIGKNLPIGGHIHIELTRNIDEAIMHRLQQILVACYLPLLGGENAAAWKARGSYAKVENFRTASASAYNKDGAQTYEFRFPSGQWLDTPKIATGTIALIGTVWHAALQNERHFKKVMDFFPGDKNGSNSYDLLQAAMTFSLGHWSSLFAGYRNDVLNAIRTTPYYNAYQDELEFILDPIRLAAERKNISPNLLHSWGLLNPQTIKKERSEAWAKVSTPLKKHLAENDGESGNNKFNIIGEGRKLERYAQALAEEIGERKLRLTNSYSIAPIKKGLPCLLTSAEMGARLRIETETKEALIKDEKDSKLMLQLIKHQWEENGSESDIILAIPYNWRPEKGELNLNGTLQMIAKIEQQGIKRALGLTKTTIEKHKQDCEGRGLFALYEKPAPAPEPVETTNSPAATVSA